MHRIYKVFIIVMLICSITFVSYATELDELKDQKDQLEIQIDESNTELADINEELTENLIQIQKLDENIANSEKNLSELNEEITSMEKEVSEVEGELNEITSKYNVQKDILDQRLVAVYEGGENKYLDVLLGSKSISEFISGYFLISEITNYDLDLLDLVESEKNQIEQKNLLLSTKKEKLETQKRKMQSTQITLSNTKLLRENYISKLSEEEQILQAKIDEYNNQIQLVEKEIKELALTASFGEDYQGGTMQWPVYDHYTITSTYGMRTHPITGVYKLHTGVDVSAETGTDFRAMANGIVVKAGLNTAYGNMVIIDHGGGVQTLYAHGSEIEVEVGQVVKAGDVVLKVGMTGYATGPHAHFEIRINGNTVNPLNYIPSLPEEVARYADNQSETENTVENNAENTTANEEETKE